MKRLKMFLAALIALSAASASAQTFPRMDELLARYDQEVKKLQERMGNTRPDPRNSEWVKKETAFLFDRDQFARRFMAEGYKPQYSEDERRYFAEKMSERMNAALRESVTELKKITREHGWVKISKFGEQADNQAWVLVANAESDRPFQTATLQTLAKLWPQKETSPRNYAFLADQLAVASQKPQDYGTQGRCAGVGQWEPAPIANPDRVDERRAAMGMEPLQEYVERFKEICK